MESSPRVLVLSNSCFCSTDSNGRTLAKLFQHLPADHLAQFFTYGIPDFQVCKNYYQVSDRDALSSFLKHRPYGGAVSAPSEIAESDTASNKAPKPGIQKNPVTVLAREFAWKFGFWKAESLYQWVSDFNPSCVFVCASDNIFLLDLAGELGKKQGIPVVLYSTEDYYFKKYNYLTRKKSAAYCIFHRMLQKAYHRVEPFVSLGIFNSEFLKQDYARAFSFPCRVVYPKSDVSFVKNSQVPENPQDLVVSYLGNLVLNRHKALMEIADTMAEIVPGLRLNVYGKIPDNIKDEFLGNANIHYCGFVPYDEVVRVMHSSSLLLHAEYNDPFYNEDLKHAFSTKIADSISCGTPFFLYAPGMLTETQFIQKHKCGFCATSKDELKETLRTALFNCHARELVLSAAQSTAEALFRDNKTTENQ